LNGCDSWTCVTYFQRGRTKNYASMSHLPLDTLYPCSEVPTINPARFSATCIAQVANIRLLLSRCAQFWISERLVDLLSLFVDV
jgi:hypothetical protein